MIDILAESGYGKSSLIKLFLKNLKSGNIFQKYLKK
jgi:ABC-type transport system involved in cytochrome bd biosynthesis fused ATPase/permease subunit